jgi:hypothetical protein
MPFNPKLVRSDDSTAAVEGSLDLPPELAVLGDVLRADAQQLADSYPPPQHAASSAVHPLVQRWSSFHLGAAAALLAVGLGIAGQIPLRRQPADDRLSAAAMAERALDAGAESTPSATPLRLTSTDARGILRVAELTGPELEALVDLVQRESNASTSVSF